MQSADDVEFRDGFAPAFARAMPHFFERHGVGFGIAHALAERAQPAARHANVGRVDVAVDVEICGVAVHPLAHQIRHVAQRQNILVAIERNAIFERQPFAGFHLFADGEQAGIVDCNLHMAAL